jgi:serine/threonine protein kinase
LTIAKVAINLILNNFVGGPLSYHLVLLEPQYFSERKVTVLIAEIIVAVEELHRHNIIHR